MAAMDEGIPPMLLARLVQERSREAGVVVVEPEHPFMPYVAEDLSPAVRNLVSWAPEQWAQARAFLDARRRH